MTFLSEPLGQTVKFIRKCAILKDARRNYRRQDFVVTRQTRHGDGVVFNQRVGRSEIGAINIVVWMTCFEKNPGACDWADGLL